MLVGGSAGEIERRDATHFAQLSGRKLAEDPGDRSREHDHRRLQRLGGLYDRRDRGARSEVADAPAVAPQQQPERHEREVVLLALDAGEQCSRPLTAIPPTREGHEPAPDEVARKVLLRDRDLTTLPALAELTEVRQEASSSMTSTVKAERRRSKAACAPASSNESSAAASAADASAMRRLREPGPVGDDEPRRLCCREAPVEVGAHLQDAADVLVAVETKPPTRALGSEQAVTALPGAQQLDRDADAT